MAGCKTVFLLHPGMHMDCWKNGHLCAKVQISTPSILQSTTLSASKRVDCKTVCIFACSSTCEQSNKRSGMRLKMESETRDRLSLPSHALQACKACALRPASYPVILSNFRCDVTCQACWENLRYRTRFEASSGNSENVNWPGYEAALRLSNA